LRQRLSSMWQPEIEQSSRRFIQIHLEHKRMRAAQARILLCPVKN